MSASSSAGAVCAAAASIEATLTPATSIGSRAQLHRILGIIARPHFTRALNAFTLLRNYGASAHVCPMTNVMAGHSA
jgi:hypothetical protein